MLNGRSRTLMAFVVVAGLSGAAARAQTEASPPLAAAPADELVREALGRAPAIAARAAAVDAARALEEPAGALPNPTLELMLQDAGFPDWTVGEEEMSMIGPQLTQGFPFPGKQGKRKAAAAAETGVRREVLESLRRQIARDVRRSYAEIYAIDQELALLAASQDLIQLLSATVAHHVETQEMDQEAAVKAQLLGSRAAEKRTDLEAERVKAVAMLNRILDRPGNAAFGVVESLPEPEPPPAALDSMAESVSGDVVVRNAGVTAAEARLRATRSELRPDFMAGAGIGFRGDLDPVVTFALGIELPIWQAKSQRPLIRSAEAELEVARHELRDARAAARAEAASLSAEWRQADDQIRRYEDSFIPQTRLAFETARSAYLVGRADFSTVIEDFNLWLEARTGLARRVADRYATWAALEALYSPAPPATEGDTP